DAVGRDGAGPPDLHAVGDAVTVRVGVARVGLLPVRPVGPGELLRVGDAVAVGVLLRVLAVADVGARVVRQSTVRLATIARLAAIGLALSRARRLAEALEADQPVGAFVGGAAGRAARRHRFTGARREGQRGEEAQE